MSQSRQQLGESGSRTPHAEAAATGAKSKSQSIKLVLACVMLAAAGVLIAWQSGIFSGASPAPAPTTPTAGAGSQQAPDSPEVPVTKTGSGRARPLEQK